LVIVDDNGANMAKIAKVTGMTQGTVPYYKELYSKWQFFLLRFFSARASVQTQQESSEPCTFIVK
jgi:hypothetical protein